MLSRALSLATVTLLIGCFAADPAPAQTQNLEAGKSPSQIFAGTCTACHKGPRGLLKTVPAGSLPGFLKQHYTTSPEMASLLAAFLVSNGATDTRYVGNQGKSGKDEKSEPKPGGLSEQLDRFGRRLRLAPAQEAAKPEDEPKEAAKPDAKPDADGLEPARRGRNAKRLARPGETPPAAEGQAPDQAASERGPDGRKLSAKRKLSKWGKRGGEEPPKSESAKTESPKTESPKTEPGKTESGKEESAKGEAAKEETPKNETGKTETGKTETGKTETGKTEAGKGDTAKVESGKPEGTKPEGAKPPAEAKSESTKIEAPKETGSSAPPTLRADPVPPVTPAPPAASPAVSAAVTSGTAEPSAGPSAPQPAPPVSVPPVAPAGPPAPPISQ
ncbi:hypothetical protein [Bradyrhizobium sp.]|uniref:hypothetical protein n=1 Tax=Bradyrhizobium sp. TaxID=376 RepID=UPI0025C07966|nr:hypothetical protein [Bradyrhizobium sp.]